MTKKFTVYVSETMLDSVEVEAKDEAEARKIVADGINKGTFDLMSPESNGVKIDDIHESEKN